MIDGRALVVQVALRWKPQGREGMRQQTEEQGSARAWPCKGPKAGAFLPSGTNIDATHSKPQDNGLE